MNIDMSPTTPCLPKRMKLQNRRTVSQFCNPNNNFNNPSSTNTISSTPTKPIVTPPPSSASSRHAHNLPFKRSLLPEANHSISSLKYDDCSFCESSSVVSANNASNGSCRTVMNDILHSKSQVSEKLDDINKQLTSTLHNTEGDRSFINHFILPPERFSTSLSTLQSHKIGSPHFYNSSRFISDFHDMKLMGDAQSAIQTCTTLEGSKIFGPRTVFIKRSAKSMTKSKSASHQLLLESQALSRLQHPNIVQYLSSWSESFEINLMINYCPGGSLHNYICHYGDHKRCENPASIAESIRMKSDDSLTYKTFLKKLSSLKLTIELLSAIIYVHRRGIFHNDISSTNVIIDFSHLGKVNYRNQFSSTSKNGEECVLQLLQEDSAKYLKFVLCDFGLAKRMDANLVDEEVITDVNCELGKACLTVFESIDKDVIQEYGDVFYNHMKRMEANDDFKLLEHVILDGYTTMRGTRGDDHDDLCLRKSVQKLRDVVNEIPYEKWEKAFLI